MKSTNCKSSYNYSVEARTPVSSIVIWMVSAISIASITTAIAQPAEATTSAAVATAQATKVSTAVAQALAVVAVVAHGVRSGESDLVL